MAKKMKIGIVCDNYKADFFRKGLLEEGYELEHDEPNLKDTHLFRIEVDETDYLAMKLKVHTTTKRLEYSFKHLN